MAGMASTRPDFGILLVLAYQQFVIELRAEVAEQGFTDQGRSDGYVLRALGESPMTTSELAERLEISKQGAGQIVEDMERRGYLERRPDPRDGRARLLHLSEYGQAALAAARRFHQRYERRLVREHGAEAVETLRAVLGAMVGEEQAADPRFRALYL
jgi:DNA-binding MarR family transcriptional regulator